jgi:hypothetical protein
MSEVKWIVEGTAAAVEATLHENNAYYFLHPLSLQVIAVSFIVM